MSHDIQYYFNMTDDEFRKAHFFAQMEGVTATPFVNFGIPLGMSDGRRTWRECVVDESRYKVEDGYKVTLRSIDGSGGYEHYYVSDLASLVRSCNVLLKGDESSRVEHIVWTESLVGDVSVRHEADIVVSDDVINYCKQDAEITYQLYKHFNRPIIIRIFDYIVALFRKR